MPVEQSGGIASYCRLKGERYNLIGEVRVLEDETVQYKLRGSTTWTEPQPNGHRPNENPFEHSKEIYKADRKTSDNDRVPTEAHDSVEISANTS